MGQKIKLVFDDIMYNEVQCQQWWFQVDFKEKQGKPTDDLSSTLSTT